MAQTSKHGHPDWFLRGEDPAYIRPGPEERKLRSRIVFKLTGRWPQRHEWPWKPVSGQEDP